MLYKTDFMALNKNHISHLLPQEDFVKEEELF